MTTNTLTELFNNTEMADEIATALQCIEVDVIALALAEAGHHDAARHWITTHAYDDDSGDAHRHDDDNYLSTIYDLQTHQVVVTAANETEFAAAKETHTAPRYIIVQL